MKRLHATDRVASGPSFRWEGLAAVIGISIVSLLLFYLGLPLWAVVVIQLIGFYILKMIFTVAFTRTDKSS